MTIYLYVKTHTKTGLKYLGKTEQDPYTYRGSGKYWKLHLNKHGDDVWTNVIFQSDDKDEIRRQGVLFSTLWDVVSSKEWANLKLEEGDGGTWNHSDELKTRFKQKFKGEGNPMFGVKRSDEWKEKHSEFMKGRKSGESNPMFGKTHSKEVRELIRSNMVGKVWVNNGKITKRFYPDQIPEVFIIGRM
jgi:hypothetical protein